MGNTSGRCSSLSHSSPQGIYGAAVALLCWTCPESPRWLMQNGRSEEALAWLIRYHGNGDPNSAIVKLEFEEFQDNIALDGSDKRWWDYRELFRTKNARWRFLMVMMISVFGQFSGNGLGYFQNVIYNNLGYTSPQTILGLNLAGSFLSAACALVAAGFADRMPRVKTLTFGTLGELPAPGYPDACADLGLVPPSSLRSLSSRQRSLLDCASRLRRPDVSSGLTNTAALDSSGPGSLRTPRATRSTPTWPSDKPVWRSTS